MKRETWLMVKQGFWLSPFILLYSPWLIAEVSANELYKFAGWLKWRIREVNKWLIPRAVPTWWPSHAIQIEIEREQWAERQKLVDELAK